MPRKNEYINCNVLHISELFIYLELKIKSSFLRIIKKLKTLQWYLDIFSQIVFNPLKLWTIQQLSSCADQWGSITAVINFWINFKTTFHALLLCILICEIGCRKTTIIILISWGGYSKRLPSHTCSGKIFSPLPILPTQGGPYQVSLNFDRIS